MQCLPEATRVQFVWRDAEGERILFMLDERLLVEAEHRPGLGPLLIDAVKHVRETLQAALGREPPRWAADNQPKTR